MIYIKNSKTAPIGILYAFLALGIATDFFKRKFESTFFKRPVVSFWKTSLEKYKLISKLKFTFDDSKLSRAEFYVITGMVFGLMPIWLIVDLFLSSDTSKNITNISLPIMFSTLAMAVILFFAVYYPSWQLYKKFKNEDLEKPYWYCFSYQTHWSRQQHIFKQSTAAIRKPKAIAVAASLFFSLIVLFDLMNGSQYLTQWLIQSKDLQKTLEASPIFIFLELGILLTLIPLICRFFYIEELLESARD